MHFPSTELELQALQRTGPLLVLFGGARCAVCLRLKPKLDKLLAERFPAVDLAYVDCEQAKKLCAQSQVFSVPVLRLYVDGRHQFEWVRYFSLGEVARQIECYSQWWRVD